MVEAKNPWPMPLVLGVFLLADGSDGVWFNYLVTGESQFYGGDKLIGGTNMTAIHLANAVEGICWAGYVGGNCNYPAVVAGLTVSGGAAISHDFYAQILCKGKPDEKKELFLTRVTTVIIGVIAVLLGIAFQNENVGFIATMPMVVAASVNFPILFLSLFWSGLTTRGAVLGALVGLISSVTLIVIGPQVWVSVLGFENAIFPYNYPALFTMPLAIITTWIISGFDRSARGDVDRSNYYLLLPQSSLDQKAAD